MLVTLIFDTGPLVIGCGGEGLELAVPRSEDEVPENLLSADEDEPWWTVIGCELRDVSAEAAALHLRFRRDDDNPKIVTLRAADGQIRISSRHATA